MTTKQGANYTLSAGIVIAAALVFWTMGLAQTTFSTYAFVGAVLLTLAVITINTYKNARPSRTMGRLLHDPDVRSRRAGRDAASQPRS